MQLGSIPWQFMLEQQAQQQAPQGKKAGSPGQGGGLAGLVSLFSALGEDTLGPTAPNVDGMEGIGVDPGPASPIGVPQPQPQPWQAGTSPTLPSEAAGGHPYLAPTAEATPSYVPGKGQMAPLPAAAIGYGPPAPGDPLAFLKNDPQLVNRVKAGGAPLDTNNLQGVILHDRGGSYNGSSPYHVEVLPNGQIVQSYAGDQKAPHAYKANPNHLGVAYGGDVGSMPTQAARSSLQRVIEGLKMHNPSWTFEGHGEAFNRTRGGPFQASRSGRGLEEARWRRFF